LQAPNEGVDMKRTLLAIAVLTGRTVV